MKRKRRQRWIAMLMAVVMLASTMGSTGLAQSLQNETADSETIQKQEESYRPNETIFDILHETDEAEKNRRRTGKNNS